MKIKIRNAIVWGGLIVLLSVLAFLFQGRRGLWQPDEGYYVGTAMTMLDKHSFLIPYLGGEEIFLDKPPLMYWGIISSVTILGQTEFAVRFFHGVCYVVTCLTVGLLAWSMFGNRRLIVLSSVAYGTMLAPFVAANVVTPDTLLALWTAIFALAFWKSITTENTAASLWKVILFCALGFGFLTKGPAVLIPTAGMPLFLLLRRQLKMFLWDRGIAIGIAAFLFIGLGWYIWIGCKLSGGFAYFFDNQIWGRLVSGKYDRNSGLAGAAIYLFMLTVGTLPWCVVCLQKPARSLFARYVTKAFWLNLVNEPQKLFLISWLLLPLLLLCLASSKLPLYALPLMAPVAIACTKLWSDRIDVVALQAGMKSVVRGVVRFILIWCVLLVSFKYALAIYPSKMDCRALWQEISKYVPAKNYEICTINQRADGLIFYGAEEVEHITIKQDPYPTFTKPLPLLEEISKDVKEGENKVMLLLTSKTETADKTCSILSNAGIEFNRIKLSGQRWLIILQPESYNKAQ
jgi:4-amino-4-deoxy-L-arabinose transferase-like glycosyltransferase